MKTLVASTAMLGLLFAVAWVAWPASGTALELPPVREEVAAPEGPVQPASRPLERVAVESPPAPSSQPRADSRRTEEPADPSPTLVEPYLVRILVVDPTHSPVAAAEVRLFAARQRHGGHGTGQSPYLPGRSVGGAALFTGRTDDTGRCVLTTDRERALLFVEKAGVGDSGDVTILPERARGGKEVIVILGEPLVLRGLVLRGDGQPASGVRVTGHVSGAGFSEERQAKLPDAAATDDEGRFAMRLDTMASVVDLTARDGDAKSHPVSVRVPQDLAREVVIRFPGFIGLRGVLVDPAGQPVAGGQVTVGEVSPREGRGDRPRGFRAETTTTERGRFEVDLPHFGSYTLAARATGYASSLTLELAVSEAATRRELVLRLFAPVRLPGVITWEGGRPIAGRPVEVNPDVREDAPWDTLTQDDRYSRVKSVISGDDGTFVLEGLHPEVAYRVTCTPDPARYMITVTRRGIRGDLGFLAIVVREAEVRTSVLAGRVLASDGGPVPRFTLSLTRRYDLDGLRAWSIERELAARDQNGRFEINDLPRDAVYWLEIRLPLSVPFVHGPVTLDRERVEVTPRASGLGSVRVQVVDPQGQPAPHVPVGFRPVDPLALGSSFMLPQRTSEDGVHVKERLPEGRFFVSATVAGKDAVKQEVEVLPGRTVEVKLTLR